MSDAAAERLRAQIHFEDKAGILNCLKQDDAVRIDNDPPLFYAVQNNKVKAAKILLDWDKQAKKVNLHFITLALQLAVSDSRDMTQMVDLLIGHGADIEWENPFGERALMFAAHMGHENVVHTLVEYGAKVDARNSALCTAFFNAATNGREKISLYLLDRGAEINVQNKDGIFPLIMTAGNNEIRFTQTLIARGANVRMALPSGETTLMRAAFWNNVPLATWLLENFDFPKEERQKALDAARDDATRTLFRNALRPGAILRDTKVKTPTMP